MSWLDDVYDDVLRVKLAEVPEPQRPVDEWCETVVGVAPPNIRRLYYVAMRARSDFNKYVGDSQESVHTSPGEAAQRSHLKTQSHLLRQMLLYSLQEEFPDLREKTTIKIRHGWKVVWQHVDPASPPQAEQTQDSFNSL